MKNPPNIEEQIKVIKAALAKSKQSIVLIGLMGAGKSKLGKELAKALDMDFRDSDDVFVERHGEITQFFETYGEVRFRHLEREIISQMMSGEPQVMATGGGAYINDQTRNMINEDAISVWLDISPEDTMKRFDYEAIQKRPKLHHDTKSPLQMLKELYSERAGIYSQANLRVSVSDDMPTKEESVAQNRDRVINALYMHLKP